MRDFVVDFRLKKCLSTNVNEDRYMASPMELRRTRQWRYSLTITEEELSHHQAWSEAMNTKNAEFSQDENQQLAAAFSQAMLGQLVYEPQQ